MSGAQLVEMARVAEQEHLQRRGHSARSRPGALGASQSARPGTGGPSVGSLLGPSRMVLVFRRAEDSPAADLTSCVDC